MGNFFSALKDVEVDECLRFVFITGISKFSKTSIFSGLNNLQDLSMEPQATQLLGCTNEEIKGNYAEYIQDISKKTGQSVGEILEQITHWYNGYQFVDPTLVVEAKVYNPYSVMLYLQSGRFDNYWFDTGTPTYLMRLLKKKDYPIETIEGSELHISQTKSYEISDIKLVPLLFQAGYLTIETYDPDTKNYRLRFPNEEVRAAARLLMSCENPNGNSPREKSELEARRAAQQVIGNAEASQQSPPREGKQVIGP